MLKNWFLGNTYAESHNERREDKSKNRPSEANSCSCSSLTTSASSPISVKAVEAVRIAFNREKSIGPGGLKSWSEVRGTMGGKQDDNFMPSMSSRDSIGAPPANTKRGSSMYSSSSSPACTSRTSKRGADSRLRGSKNVNTSSHERPE